MDFLVIFTSDRYHRDMKILKILASNSKSSEFMAFSKNDKQNDDDRGLPNTTFSYITSA